MSESVELVPELRARAAIAEGRWDAGHRELSELGSRRELTPEELELLADAAYGAGRFEATIGALERAHTAYLERHDQLGAAGAATRVATYLMMDSGLMAPVRGWTRRAERLLEGCDEAPVHAWLAMVQAYERFLSGDTDGAARAAERAIASGTRQGEPAPVALARLARARLIIFAGRVEEGLALLDEVAVVVVAGELEPLPAGMVFCELICAMQGLAQYDRAAEWTDAMERWRAGTAFGGIDGRCRVHRAEILRLRGSCAEAEDEALSACDELRPWMRREFGWPLTELGTIRLRRGDLAGAEDAFLAAHRLGWDPHPGLALLRLEQGDAAGAAALIDDAVRRPSLVPSKERPPHSALQRAPLLAAQAEIAVAVGDVGTALRAAEELTDIADRFQSRALEASAALARGRVALADDAVQDAIGACEHAVACWGSVGAPYETAAAQLVLAESHRAAGNHQACLLEAQAALASFERIGASRGVAAALRACRDTVDPGARRAAWPVRSGRTVFRCEGDTRHVEYGGRAVLVRDLKGMRYLTRLLAEPGREFHALDLVAAERGEAPAAPRIGAADGLTVAPGDDLGPLLDDQAKAAYRRRLREVDEDIEEALAHGDTERRALAAADREFLLAELSRAVGLAGRDREVGSSAERARTSVTRALRYAMGRIGEHHPALAEHLAHTVRTGTYCTYDPEARARVSWEL